MRQNRQTEKRYDLEDRTLAFAKRVRALVKRLPKSHGNFEDCKQLIRSSGSIGANYIEANEALSNSYKEPIAFGILEFGFEICLAFRNQDLEFRVIRYL